MNIKLFALSFALFFSLNAAFGSATEQCMQIISAHSDTFTDILYSEIVKDSGELTQDFAKRNKPKILALIASNVLMYCMDGLADISDGERAKLPFVHDGKKYAFDFSIPEMFEYINIRTGIFVYNNRTKSYPDVVKVSDIPKLYWSDSCSDHTIWDNLDDDAAVNVAGQRTFKEYGGADHEYFLDFEKGNDMRAFPGLVLQDVTSSTEEKIVAYSNFIAGKQAAQNFAAALQNSACSNQSLAVYLVALDTAPDPNNKDAWAIGASIGGGAMALIGLGAWAATGTAVAASGSMLLVNTVLGLSATASAIPVAGWIIAGIGVAVAGVISLTPTKLQDIEQVAIMAGPYNIN